MVWRVLSIFALVELGHITYQKILQRNSERFSTFRLWKWIVGWKAIRRLQGRVSAFELCGGRKRDNGDTSRPDMAARL